MTEYKTFSYEDVPLPEIGDDDVLIQVKACGICGSEVHAYHGLHPFRILPID